MTGSTYYIFSTIISSVGFVLAIGSILLVWTSIRQSIKTREVDILLKLFSMSTSPDFRNYMDIVRKITPKEELAEEKRKACGRVCVFFELLGAIIKGKYMRSTLIEDTYGSLVTSMYDKLRWFIDKRRKEAYGSMFAANFEFLYEKIRRKPRVSRSPGELNEKTVRSSRW